MDICLLSACGEGTKCMEEYERWVIAAALAIFFKHIALPWKCCVPFKIIFVINLPLSPTPSPPTLTDSTQRWHQACKHWCHHITNSKHDVASSIVIIDTTDNARIIIQLQQVLLLPFFVYGWDKELNLMLMKGLDDDDLSLHSIGNESVDSIRYKPLATPK